MSDHENTRCLRRSLDYLYFKLSWIPSKKLSHGGNSSSHKEIKGLVFKMKGWYPAIFCDTKKMFQPEDCYQLFFSSNERKSWRAEIKHFIDAYHSRCFHDQRDNSMLLLVSSFNQRHPDDLTCKECTVTNAWNGIAWITVNYSELQWDEQACLVYSGEWNGITK